MREIKFRAWLEFEKHMIAWENLHLETDKSGFFLWVGDEDLNDNFGCASGESEFKLMQYTGLKDKNGREIYEGDIVEFKTMSRVERHYVEYSEYGEWCVGMHRLSMRFQTCEVVGNIFENPELLEVVP